MLAHLLGDVEGQEFPRDRVSESFRSKAQGAFLPALLTKADRIPAKSLLFNIDQKATLITKDQTDALLKVFVKVFDESRGYYGNQGHVARFERDLDNRGQYETFKAAYARIAGIATGRRAARRACSKSQRRQGLRRGQRSGEGTPTNILTKYRDSYSVSIEDFADEVKAWLDKQRAGLPAELLRRRGWPVHRVEHPPDAQPPDDRRVPQHQVRRAGRGCSSPPRRTWTRSSATAPSSRATTSPRSRPASRPA